MVPMTNASGVGLLLETANRIIDVDTNYTIRFILFDLGESQHVGSHYHISQASQEYLDNIACYINLDTLAMGDSMYIYGGSFDGTATSRTWLVEQAAATAEDMGLDIGTIQTSIPDTRFPQKPQEVTRPRLTRRGFPISI